MAVDAKTRGLQVLETLYPDPTVRQARAEELGEAGIATLGNHVLRQDDYSRQANELTAQRTAAQTAEEQAKALYEQNKAWFDQKQKDLQELDQLRQRVSTGVVTPPVADPADPKLVTAEDLAKTLAETERGAVAFFNDLNRLSLEHYQRFGEILDTEALLTDKRVQQLGLRGVYTERYKPQLDALVEKQRKEAEDKIRADERTKVLAERASTQHPYPVRGNEPSTLDALERPGQAPQAKTVDDMAAEYVRLTAQRTGVPA